MEYLYIVLGLVAAIIAVFLLLQVKAIRDKANALFLEAEKNITKDKLEYVSSNLYYALPSYIRIFLNEEGFYIVVQKIYDKSRKLAKDILNDGKINGK